MAPPRPKLLSMETGEVKQDKEGNTVFTVGLSVADNESGRVELVNVAVSGDPGLSIGQIVTPVRLVGFPWEQHINGVLKWGIAFKADRIVPAGADVQAA
ncbi:hypothetical protein [Actinocorallia herbida]|uniref:SCO3933 family regulatory protein n=1 Tax=Actinocorallia herbida TaxID=58109 RepID=UPI001FED2375|nr:hypothetical protein [Actinocorallia herbida]